MYQFNQTKKNRHQVYIKALKHTGIEVVLGRFKTKDMYCKNCRTSFQSHEEKRTDVNIALYLTHLAYKDVYDTALLVTGDTDLIPAIEMVKDSFPDKKIGVVFPYRRINDDLKDAADFNRKIEPRDVYRSIFPDRIEIKKNTIIHCPSDWK